MTLVFSPPPLTENHQEMQTQSHNLFYDLIATIMFNKASSFRGGKRPQELSDNRTESACVVTYALAASTDLPGFRW